MRRVLGILILGLTVWVALTAHTVAEQRSQRQYAPLTRYSLVHGCYRVRTGGRQLGPFTMQAAALGQYLLYGAGGDYLGPTLTQVASPDNSTIWRVDRNGRGRFRMTNLGTGRVVPVTFSPARGCATYPEAQVGATGTPFSGPSPEAQVRGTIDAHSHLTFFEAIGGDFHCGRPWSPFGAPYALPASCAHYQQGTNGEAEAFLDFGSATRPSDMHGWPTFKEWPSPSALIEEGTYYTGIQRAWMAGMRLFVAQFVDNEALCMIMTTRHNPCDDVAAVRLQDRDLHELQDYIDAQAGGPGKGWFRIVTNPFQARRVINHGKLAVVESIELEKVMGCGETLGVPQCGTAQVDAGLRELKAMGISGFFPVHKADNSFGGTKMDGGETGVLTNAGNYAETGHFYNVKTCTGPESDKQQISPPASGPLADLINGPLGGLTGGAPVPVYPSGPSCNQRGLTPVGEYLLRAMMKRHLIIELDHMDVKTANAALQIINNAHYAGIVSSHSWDAPQDHADIYRDGGIVTPYGSGSIADWRADRAVSSPRFPFGYGFGSDMNGIAGQNGPGNAGHISYPFHSLDGNVTLTREVWGQRTFDLNTDGVANYGMYADALAAQVKAGGRKYRGDLLRGAEAYLDMWERAYGVPASRCPRASALTASGLGKLRLGSSYVSALRAAGQPSSRPGRSYRYCSAAGVFGPAGRLVLISSKGSGVSAGGIRVGASGVALRGRAKQVAPGIWISGDRRFVYGTRGGRVSFAAVASGSELGDPSLLRSDLRAAGL